jgi:hypothetical protein
MKRKKVFLGTHEIAGYYANLAGGFRAIGVECDFVTYTPHPFSYGGETQKSILLSLARFFNGFRGKLGRPFVLKSLIALPGEVFGSIYGIYAIFAYDVFIFGGGHSLMTWNIDLRLLKLMGKIVISNIAHGTDARPPYINGTYQSKDGRFQPTTNQLLSYSKNRRKKVAVIERYSNVVLGAPFSTTHFSCRRLVNTFAIGVPLNSEDPGDSTIDHAIPMTHTVPLLDVRILHSPSHPAAKGTPLIVQAVSNLKLKGHKIELIMLQNKPHAEVIREIQLCDFVVDQIYSDTPMAGFATEAAWFGKSAVVGGYGFDYLKTLLPESMWPPSMTCHPDALEQAIEDLIVNREKRLQLGVKAQGFVRANWNTTAVARRYLRLIEGDIPEKWLLDPKSVVYLEGCGQPVERTQEIIRRMVAKFGVESLQLSHRLDLERAFLEFAGVKSTP